MYPRTQHVYPVPKESFYLAPIADKDVSHPNPDGIIPILSRTGSQGHREFLSIKTHNPYSAVHLGPLRRQILGGRRYH